MRVEARCCCGSRLTVNTEIESIAFEDLERASRMLIRWAEMHRGHQKATEVTFPRSAFVRPVVLENRYGRIFTEVMDPPHSAGDGQ